jgi:anti-anti-sigma factor
LAIPAAHPHGRILVGTDGAETDGRTVFMKVEGRATHLIGPALKRCLTELEARGMHTFRLDLSACQVMDSTFLGVLASTCMRLKEQPGGRFALEGVSARNHEQLKMLGIAALFDVRAEPGVAPASLHELPLQAPSTDGWADCILEAHDALARADRANAERFEDVIRLLVESR